MFMASLAVDALGAGGVFPGHERTHSLTDTAVVVVTIVSNFGVSFAFVGGGITGGDDAYSRKNGGSSASTSHTMRPWHL